MLIFAHLRKCAGTSVVEAAAASGVKLPPGHRNGHPVGPDGHAMPGLSRMAATEIAGILGPMAASGVQLTAIEWDFPRFEAFPSDLGLRFFTIVRDPIERLLSNYAYDVVSGFTASRAIRSYLGEGGIWTMGNYYTRFFSGRGPGDAVGPEDVDYVLDILTSHFAYAFLEEDLLSFLVQEVGLQVTRLRHSNRKNRLLQLLRRSSLRVSAADLDELRAANALDLRLCDALRRVRAQGGRRAG